MLTRPEPWLLAAAAAVSAVLAVVVIFQAMGVVRDLRIRKEVLGRLRGGEQPSDTQNRNHATVVRTGTELDEGVFGVLARRIPQLWDLHHLMVQSAVGWTLGGFLARTVGLAMLLGLISRALLPNPSLAAVAFVFGAAGPYAYLRRKKGKRLLRLESQLPETIDLIARAVRAGHPLSEGLRMAAEETQDPLATEFRITFDEQKFGLPFEEALLGLGDRVEVVDVRIVITAILVQREVGGNLSEILEKIAETMRARFSLKRQVRIYTAQGRMSGYILAALPIFVGAVITLINPEYMETLFYEPLGQALLTGAVIMQTVGFLFIRRIVDIRY